jgi:replication-associated recombination protein RarA
MGRELLYANDISHIADAFDPSSIDEIVFPSEAVETYLKRWVSRSTATRNLLIYGPPGTGKTRASYLLASQRCSAFLELSPIRYVECESGTFDELLQIQKNESMLVFRSIDSSFESVLILDEVDNFKPPQQKQLKKIMERVDRSHILLTNNLNNLDVGIRNRCVEIPWFIPSFEQCKIQLRHLARKVTNKTLDDRLLRENVYTRAGWRQMVRNLDALGI